jgi:16S rRNA (guanine966-N2)-methyltransferase
MRIISGIFKGKKIILPDDKNTRPLKDLTKESIFNIIKHSNKFDIQLDSSYILDLFSGVGSFGIECLSRQVKFI